MDPVVTVAAVAVLAIAGGVFALDRLALRTLRPPVREVEVAPGELGLRAEDVRIPAPDGKLRGWLVRSGPATIVSARHFRDDVLAVARFLSGRFPDRPKVLAGYSMGGAACVLAAAQGAPTSALVLLATPADVMGATVRWFRSRGLPGGLLVRVFTPFWQWRVGVPFRDLRPGRRIGETTVPALILQGDRDDRVPVREASALARGAPGGGLLRVFEGVDHAQLLTRPEAHGEVVAFLADL